MRRRRQERVGFLFGRVRKERHIVVERAALYRGGRRASHHADVKVVKMADRRYELGLKLHLQVLGTFHSHISDVDELAHGVSPDDRLAFADDIFAPIAVIVAVRPAVRTPNRTSKRALIGYEPRLGCSFNIRAYSISEPRIRMLPVNATD
ncbi:MAG TPA: hypothetical protein VMH22_10895 [bacterium]|nr:hypothetical protein [bacterium]